MVAKRTQQLFDTLVGKATLKQKVYRITLTTLNMLKKGMVQLTTKYEEVETDLSKEIPFTFKDRSEFEAELKFAGSVERDPIHF